MNPTRSKKKVVIIPALLVVLSVVFLQTRGVESQTRGTDEFAPRPVDGYVAIVATGTGAARYPGYAKQSDLTPPASVPARTATVNGKPVLVPDIPNVPVYSATDLKTVVGHMVMGIGFVPIGTDLSKLNPFAGTNQPTHPEVANSIPK